MDLGAIDRGGKGPFKIAGFHNDARGASGGPVGTPDAIPGDELAPPTGEILSEQVRTAKGHHDGPVLHEPHDALRHDASVHDMHELRPRGGEAPLQLVANPVVDAHTFGEAIKHQNVHLQSRRTNRRHLLLDEGARRRMGLRRIHIRHGEYA